MSCAVCGGKRAGWGGKICRLGRVLPGRICRHRQFLPPAFRHVRISFQWKIAALPEGRSVAVVKAL
jgi:hypothetical protein